MEIILNDKLRKEEIRATHQSFVTATLMLDETNTMSKVGQLVEKSKDFSYYHRNYLEYLMMCWANHRGAIVNPTILWNIVLNEIATEIKGNSEKYRFLFTKQSEGKQKIVITQNEQYKLDVEQMCAILKNFVPSNIDVFLPSFSTDTEMSTIAQQTTFLDTISPYYEYAFTKCGIPKVRIDGTFADYRLFYLALCDIYRQFVNVSSREFLDYLHRVISNIADFNWYCKHQDQAEGDFGKKDFNNMFKIEKCGSGHPDKLQGWILDFFMDNKERPLTEFSSLVSSIEYTDETETENPLKYRMFTGLFGCEEENDYLIPDFGYFIYKLA
jgi:hypothetical protein